MNKRILYGSLIILVFLISTTSSGVKGTSYTIGDSFTFTISKFTLSSKVNGTEYAPPVDLGLEKTNTYTVTAMNSTVTTLSYPSSGVNKTIYAVPDYFSEYFLFVFVGYLIVGFAQPGYVNFSVPTVSISQPDNIAEGPFPMFASGNISYYQSLINTSDTTDPASSPFTSDGYFNYITDALTAENNQSNNEYTLAYDIGFTKSNSSEQFSASFHNTFKAVIDLTRNILTELTVSFSSTVKQGSASLSTNIELSIVEGEAKSSINSPGFELISIFALMTIFSALTIFNKRKK